MSTFDDIIELIERSDALPWSTECAVLLGDAITTAERAGEDELAYLARMRLIQNCSYVGDSDLLVSSFFQCYQRYVSDPAKFPADPGTMPHPDFPHYPAGNLFWYFKWVPSRLMNNPGVTAETIDGILDELEATYRSNGLGLKAVFQRRLEWAVHRGLTSQILPLIKRVEALDDDYSDCKACSAHDIGRAWARAGYSTLLYKALEQVLADKLECVDEPETMVSHTLLTMMMNKSARIPVRKLQHQSYNLLRDDPDSIRAVAQHLRVLAVSGAELRALTLTDRHLPWLAHDPANLMGHFHFLGLAALACHIGREKGFGDRRILAADDPRLAHYLPAIEGGYTVATLESALWAAAEDIATRFDRRNGTDRFACDLAAWRAQAQFWREARFTWDLPIEASEAFADALEAPHLFRYQSAPLPGYTDGISCNNVVSMLYNGQREEEAKAILDEGLRTYTDPISQVLLLQRLGSIRSREGHDVSDLVAPIVAAMRAAGWTDSARVTELMGTLSLRPLTTSDDEAVQSALATARAEGVAEPAVRLETLTAFDALTDLDRTAFDNLVALCQGIEADWHQLGYKGPVPKRGIAALSWLAVYGAERSWVGWDEVKPWLDNIFQLSGYPDLVTLAHLYAARILKRDERFSEAMEHASAALMASHIYGGDSWRAYVALELAEVCSGANKHAEALAAVLYAQRLLATSQHPERHASRLTATRILLNIGQLEAGAAALAEILDDSACADQPHTIARALALRGQLERAQDKYLAAVQSFLSAASAYDAGGYHVDEVWAAFNAAELLFTHDSKAQARRIIGVALQTLDNVDDADQSHRVWGLRQDMIHLRARMLPADATASDINAAFSAVLAHVDLCPDGARSPKALHNHADIYDSWARTLASVEDYEGSAIKALQSASAYAELGDAIEEACSKQLAAHALHLAHADPRRIIDILEPIMDALATHPARQALAADHYASALEALDDPRAAAARQRATDLTT